MIVTVKTTNKESKELLSILDKAKIKYFLPKNIKSKWVVIERKDEDKTYELIKDCSDIESISYHNPYPYELISRYFINNQILKFPAVDFSDKNFVLIAGPCSIENSQQCEKVASIFTIY